MSARLPIGTRLNNYGVRAVVIGNAVDYLLAYEGSLGTTTSEDPLAEGWVIVESDADREVEALRRQVAELGSLLDGAQVFRSEHMARKTMVVDPWTFGVLQTMFPKVKP